MDIQAEKGLCRNLPGIKKQHGTKFVWGRMNKNLCYTCIWWALRGGSSYCKGLSVCFGFRSGCLGNNALLKENLFSTLEYNMLLVWGRCCQTHPKVLWILSWIIRNTASSGTAGST